MNAIEMGADDAGTSIYHSLVIFLVSLIIISLCRSFRSWLMFLGGSVHWDVISLHISTRCGKPAEPGFDKGGGTWQARSASLYL